MTTKTETLLAFPSQSGLNSNAPPTYLAPDELSVAENIVYGLNGERKKRRGFDRYNPTSIGDFNITAMSDFWRFGNSLTPTQRCVITAGGQIWSSAGDGEFTSVGSFGSDGSLITNILIAGGYAVFSNGINTVQKWDQTHLTDLDGGTGFAPRYTASAYHLSRIFAVGLATAPSDFRCSAGGDVTVWSDADTLQASLDADDQDAIIGVSRPFHKRLYMFKGPHFGSIHELSGNTLSTLQHDRIFEGLPLLNHKALITTPNDIFWMSHAGIHSLATTQQYGDTTSAFLSRPIQNFFTNELNLNRLNRAVGFWSSLYGIVGWWVTPNSGTTNTVALVYHYLISDPSPAGKKYWSIWTLSGDIAAYSAATMLTPQSESVQPSVPRLYIGGTGNGIVYAGDQTTLSDDSEAYTARVKSGINLAIGSKGPMQEMQFYSVSTFFNPVGNYDHQLKVTVDNRVQDFTVRMTGLGDVLG